MIPILSALLGEIRDGVRAKRIRSAIVVLATAVAVGLLSFTSLATALSNQRVRAQFDALADNRVVITRVVDTATIPAQAVIERLDSAALIGIGIETDLIRLPFIEGAGVYATPGATNVGPLGDADTSIRIGAVSPAAYPLVATTVVGSGITAAMDGARVIVVSRPTSDALNQPFRRGRSALFLEGRPYLVVGVADLDAPDGEAWDAVIPFDGGSEIAGALALATTGIGPAEINALAVQAAAHAPESIEVGVAFSPIALRNLVLSELAATTRWLGLAVIAAATLSTAAVGFVAVVERRWEIGLRRALGAKAHHIAIQYGGEAVALGLAGGALGALGGTVMVAVIGSVDWATIARSAPGAVLGGAALGALAGLLAGLTPAVLATRVEPVASLSER